MDAQDVQKANLLKGVGNANPAQITLTTFLPTTHASLATRTQCIIKQQALVNV